VAKLLLKHRANPDQIDSRGWGALLTTIVLHDDIQMVQMILRYRANPNSADAEGRTAVSWCVEKGQLALCEALLEYGANPDLESRGGLTPLMRAMTGGKIDFVDLLFKFRADANLETSFGLTPLCAAVQSQDLEMVAHLLQKTGKKCNLDLVTKRKGVGAIHIAVSNRSLGMVNLLLDAGACPSLPELEFGDSPAIRAATTGQVDVLKSLVQHGANLNYENHSGATALMKSLELADTNVAVFLLIEAKCDPDFGTINPLEIACRIGNEELALLLLDGGANPRLCIVEGADGGGRNLLQASLDLGWKKVSTKVCQYFSTVASKQPNTAKNGLWTTIK
jgi:ankyrin repeat protein